LKKQPDKLDVGSKYKMPHKQEKAAEFEDSKK
jgi:hypothetical protein